MVPAVPSQIVNYLDDRYPQAKQQMEGVGSAFYLEISHAPPVQRLLSMVESIPSNLLNFDSDSYDEFEEAIAAIRLAINAWSSGNNTYKLKKIPNRQKLHPLTLLRKKLVKLNDENVEQGVEWNYAEILLEPVQQELLLTIVESVRNTPIDSRQKFLVSQSFEVDTIIYPNMPKEKTQIYFGDIEALSNEGLLSLGYGSQEAPNFDVTPLGFKYYEYLKKILGEPVERIVKTVRTYLDDNNFIKAYPSAYEKWCSAEELLWKTDSKKQLTLIGHLCRESIQEFANYLISTHNLSNISADKSKTVARIKAVITKRADTLGDSKKAFLDALIAYWGTLSDLIQRQEHDSQKEGKPLVWEDARAVVFQTLIVMFEIDRNL